MVTTQKFRLVGQSAILMHNSQLANPLNPFVKEMNKITNKPKKKRTDEDLARLARLEWEGGMYFDEDNLGPYIPAANLESFINDGARKQRRGKDTLRGIIVVPDKVKLIYTGPRDVERLFGDGNSKFVDCRSAVNPSTGARVMRYRAIFLPPWSLEFTVQSDPDVVNPSEVIQFLEDAAKEGLGDNRPRYGRCEVEVVEDGKPRRHGGSVPRRNEVVPAVEAGGESVS